jgi:HlyD family secretion protein
MQLYSEVVQDLISRVPSWPVRVGNTLLLLGVGLLLVISWFIQYPDFITARATLTTTELPVRVVAPTNGKLKRLLVRTNDVVEKGAHLAVIDNPAVYEDMLVLMQWVASARGAVYAAAHDKPLAPLPGGLSVGTVQESYTAMQKRVIEHHSFVQERYYEAKKQTLHQQLAEHRELSKTLARQKALLSEQLTLVEVNLERDRTLMQKRFIAPLQFEQTQTTRLQKQYEHENVDRTLADNRIRLAELQGTLADLEQQRAERGRTLRLALLEAYETLDKQITVWHQTYVLQAPIVGQVSFFTTLQEDQFVQAPQPVMAIVPKRGEIFGKLLLRQAGAGKVKVGQRVQITLDSYLAAEFGVVEGTIEDIALVVQDAAYLIRVTLPDGLRTRYGIMLNFRQEMEGNAVIITEKIRLLARIFDWLRSTFDRHVAA